MANTRTSLTAYLIRDSIAGHNVDNFDQIVVPSAVENEALQTYPLEGDFDFDACLYSLPTQPTPPSWAEYFSEAFPDAGFPPSAMAKALLLVRIVYYRKTYYFAFSFGSGRHLLAPGSYVPGFGLRTALNAIFPAADTADSPERIRHVATKTVSANTLRTNKQSNRFASFEAFGTDLRSDLLNGVTGVPENRDQWGSRLDGADALHLTTDQEFSTLGTLCKQLLKTYKQADYKERFSWIDHITTITDPTLQEQLDEQLIKQLASNPKSFVLTPPELVEWDKIDTFTTTGNQEPQQELDLATYLASLDGKTTLDSDVLRRHRVTARDTNGNDIGSWTVYSCLDGEVTHNGTTYLLEGGDYFAIEKHYQRALDQFIATLPEANIELPPSPRNGEKEQTEGDYNESAATSNNLYLLDKKTVRVDTSTSPVEVCDLLSKEGHFIHVKRKLQSASLSHLFGQGAVAGELFVRDQAFRAATRNQVTEAAFRNQIPDGTPNTRDYEIVYAIIAKWKNRTLKKALPFFSKINLRRHAETLQSMGYKVSYKRINIVP